MKEGYKTNNVNIVNYVDATLYFASQAPFLSHYAY